MAKRRIGEVQQGREEAAPEASAVLAEGRCRHHWLIESPQGATSQGLCKFCGAVRQFRNSLTEVYWEDDSITEISRWGRRSSALSRSLDDEEELSAAPRGELALTL